MSIAIWFGTGIGSAVVLWWWRYLVSWLTWTEANAFDPLHLRVDPIRRGEPDLGWGFWAGTILTIITPLWLPFYLANWGKDALKRHSYKTLRLRQSSRRAYLSLLRGSR